MNAGSISRARMRSSSGRRYAEDQRVGEGHAEWHLVEETAVDAGDRHRSALPAGLDRLPQHVHAVGAEAHRLLDPVVARVEGRSVGLGADRAARQRDTPSFSRV
jgi:hypothetical protein